MHHHAHQHHNGHHHHRPNSLRLLWWAVVLTLGFAMVEFIAGYLAHSLALMSDGGHMLADAFSLILAAIAAFIAAKPPSSKHSYGLGRAEVLCALLSCILIFIIVAGIILEAIERLRQPSPVHGATVILVALIGLIANIVIAYLLSKGEKNLNMRAALLHVFGDILGSLAALIAGVIIYYTGWLAIDPLLSLFICVLIIIASIRLLKESCQILMEAVPAHLDLPTIGQHMASVNKVQAVHDLHIWTLASGSIVLSAHIEIDHLQEWPSVFTEVKQLLAEHYGITHITLQPEIISQIVARV